LEKRLVREGRRKMFTRRRMAVVLALLIVVGLAGVEAQGKKPPQPPPPPPGDPGDPEISCRYEGGKGKNKGIYLAVYDLNGNRTEVQKISVTTSSWSPDGESIVLDRGWGTEIWRVEVDTGTATLLYTDWSIALDPAWSPTGDKIAFSGNDITTLYLMNTDGSEVESLHSVAPDGWIEQPTWNSAGTKIAFLEHDGSDPKQVRVIELSTGTVTTVATVATNFLDWARTKDVLLYGSSQKLYTLDIETGGSAYVTDGSHASWSPDDEQIVFTENGTIYRYDLSTGTKTSIGKGRYPDWKR
jgi:Tol biopolymer transport system component